MSRRFLSLLAGGISFLFLPSLALAEPTLAPSHQSPLAASSPSQPKIQLVRFEYDGNTVFSDTQLDAVVQNWLGKHANFQDILNARDALNQFYWDQGYITSFVYVPVMENQSVTRDRGVVSLKVVEGKISQINVKGDPRLSSYIQRELSDLTRQPLSESTLQERLRFLQGDRYIASLSAELSQGLTPDTSILNIKAQAQPSLSIQAGSNNQRVSSIGQNEQRLDFGYRNPLGLGDDVSAGYGRTQGSSDWGIAYSLPLSSQRTKLGIEYRQISSRIIQAPFDQIDVRSRSQSWDVSLNQILSQRAIRNITRSIEAGVTLSFLHNQSTVLGQAFPVSLGSDAQGRTRVVALRLHQGFQQRSQSTSIALRSQFSLGLPLFGATQNTSAPDSQFFSWQGQALFLKQLKIGDFIFRGEFQIADQPLLSSEQFNLGGASSVRGFRQDALLADNGLLASLELKIPLQPKREQGFHLIPFADVGTTWNHGGNSRAPTGTLGAIGLGLEWTQAPFAARINYGFPIVTPSSNQAIWLGDRFDFSIRFNQSF
jgi:hemolysin activation/secretion protein